MSKLRKFKSTFARSPRIARLGNARRTFNVTCAKDTVVSTFSVALAAGALLEYAAEVVNLAAGIVATKFGTSTVSPDELRTAIA